MLSSNPNAIDLLRQHVDKINWKQLAKNPNAMEILEENYYQQLIIGNTTKVLWETIWCILSSNPSIFKIKHYDDDIKYSINRTVNIILT
jgi:hypothetical protein